jgi:hypothetical protein
VKELHIAISRPGEMDQARLPQARALFAQHSALITFSRQDATKQIEKTGLAPKVDMAKLLDRLK